MSWVAVGVGVGVVGLGLSTATTILGAKTQADAGQVQAAAAKQQGIAAAYTGEAQGRTFDYQAAVAQINKKIALQNADYAIASGEVSAQQSGMKTRAQIGQTKAIQGASNLDVNTGSQADVRESEHEVGVADQSTIRTNAARAAYGFTVEALSDDSQSQLDRVSAETSRESGRLGVVQADFARQGADLGVKASLLGGATSVASKWTQAYTSGMLGGFGKLGGGAGSNPQIPDGSRNIAYYGPEE